MLTITAVCPSRNSVPAEKQGAASTPKKARLGHDARRGSEAGGGGSSGLGRSVGLLASARCPAMAQASIGLPLPLDLRKGSVPSALYIPGGSEIEHFIAQPGRRFQTRRRQHLLLWATSGF